MAIDRERCPAIARLTSWTSCATPATTTGRSRASKANCSTRSRVASGARLIVEVGTSYGFSGLFWGAALKRTGGTLHTIDIEPEEVRLLQGHLRAGRAGRDGRQPPGRRDRRCCRQIAGPVDIWRSWTAGDKKSTRALFDLLWPRVRPGGSVITDNATTHKAELADFVGYVRGLAGATQHGNPRRQRDRVDGEAASGRMRDACKLFAVLRERAGRSELELDLPAGRDGRRGGRRLLVGVAGPGRLRRPGGFRGQPRLREAERPC